MIHVLLATLLGLYCQLCQSEVVYLGAGLETIEVQTGRPTVFRFPSALRTVSQVERFSIKPANEKNPDYSVLVVRPRFRSGSSTSVFVLADQSIYKIHLKVVPKNTKSSDVLYDFKDISELTNRSNGMESPTMSPIRVMQALILKNWLPGYHRRKFTQKYVKFGNVKIRLLEVLEGPIYSGLIYRVVNNSKYKVRLRQEDVRLGSTYKPVLAHVSRKILRSRGAKKSSALVRVVAKTRGQKQPERIPFSFHAAKKRRSK